MASVLQCSPPSSSYNLTIAACQPDSDAPRPLSPRHIPLLQSSSPTSPPPLYRIITNGSLKSPQACPRQPALPLSRTAKLPPSVSKGCPTPQSPPPRPPRPQTSLTNLRPTVVLSPKLISALPREDRPRDYQSPKSLQRAKAPSPTSSYSSDPNDHFSTPLSSPAFFAPGTWAKHPPTKPQNSPLQSTNSSKSISPRHPSPTSPHSYYTSKWHWENITSSDSISITALPPLPLPPPKGPLPDPPNSPPKSRSPQKDSSRTSPTIAATERKKKTKRSRKPRPTRDTTSSHFIHEVRNAQKILDTIKANAANAAVVARANIGPAQQHSPHLHQCPRAESKHVPNPHHPWRYDYHHQEPRNERKQHFLSQPSIPEFEGDTPTGLDLTYPPPISTFYRRHREKFAVLATVILVLGVTAGILAGIIWKLNSRT